MYRPELGDYGRSAWLRHRLGLPGSGRQAMLVQAIALAADLDEMAVVHQAVEKRRHRRGVAEDLRPIPEGAVRHQDGGIALVAAHDDLQQILGGSGGQFAHPQVVDDQQRSTCPTRSW